ncbi:MAG: hypothetical protein DMG12_21840 [Acidobacteria bacterium]|nr:MAG: hypothetical protein DMG12_21840 [Acidobacteriota bacterium]
MFRKVVTLGFYIFLLSISSGCNRQPAQPSFTPGLGEIMTLTQMRHAKLWFAGQGANWPLARYELDELNEGLEDAATFHPTHKDAPLPIPQLITKIMTSPIHQLEEAVGAQDQQRFIKAFDELTDACNSCHQATNFGFNAVTRPTANPYSNQLFQPVH